MTKKDFLNHLRILRETRGLTRANMDEELKKSPGTYSKIERGATDVRLSRLLSVFEVLDNDLEKFFTDKEAQPAVITEPEPSYIHPAVQQLIEAMEARLKAIENLLEARLPKPARKKPRQ